ncbi:hypothetical protein [Ereboglobus luteus]|uniref:hypothetical protein n=1 Tax=Ereboglobus luteus TaxID=1796921 RepID=UPI000D55FFA5|nr:hypothetical protein [Ereboglobus luteus]
MAVSQRDESNKMVFMAGNMIGLPILAEVCQNLAKHERYNHHTLASTTFFGFFQRQQRWRDNANWKT